MSPRAGRLGMSQTVTYQDIAGALSMAKSSIADRAVRESWPYTEQPVRGGRRRLFPVALLPQDVQAAIKAKATEALLASMPAALPVPANVALPIAFQASADLTDKQRLERDARTGVLKAIRRLMDEAGCSQEAAMTTLLTSARAAKLDPQLDAMLRLARDPRGRAGDGYPSIRTLKRWLKARDLAPRQPQKNLTVPPWAPAFLAEYQKPQKPSVAEAHREFEKTWSGEAPSLHQVRRWLDKVGRVTREMGRRGPRELKALKPFIRRGFEQLLPNDVWSADGHCFDAEVQHPLTGKAFRPEITGIVDIATRRCVGFSVDLAESGMAVLYALEHGVEQCGIPAIFYVDNGSGYKNAMMLDETVGLMGRLGISMENSLPYNSQARGVIERLHKTLWVAAAKKLPSYIGASMDREARQKQFKLSRAALKGEVVRLPLMPFGEFIAFCKCEIAEYNARAHRSLGNKSPDQVWAEKIGAVEIHPLSAEDRAAMFRPRIERTVARGEIRLFNNVYFAGALTEFHGEVLPVAYDIHDPSQVWVYATDGRFICTAEWNVNKRDYFPTSVVEQAREQRADGRLKRLDAKRAEIEAERRARPVLEVIAGGEPLVIPGIGRITKERLEGRALEAVPMEAPAAPTPRAQVFDEPAAPITKLPESAEGKFRRWMELSDLIAQGGIIDDEQEREFFATYPLTKQFAAQKRRVEGVV